MYKGKTPGPGSYLSNTGNVQDSAQHCSKFRSTSVLRFDSVRSKRFYSSMEKARKQPGPGHYQTKIIPLSVGYCEARYKSSPMTSFGKGKRHPIAGIGTNLSNVKTNH